MDTQCFQRNLLCLTLIIGTTFAFFSSDINIENIFNAGTYKTITTEVFTSPTRWKPGDETPKTIKTKNEIPTTLSDLNDFLIRKTEEFKEEDGILTSPYIITNKEKSVLDIYDRNESNGYSFRR